MTTWGRTLPKNDDNTIPGTILCVAIATTTTVDALNDHQRIHRLRCGHALAGRMENGKWTREKSLKFTSGSELIAWMNSVRQSQKPLWIFAYKIGQVLTLTSFWDHLESSEFVLSQPIPTNLANVRSEKLKRQLTRQRPGLLIDSDPPTALLCWHRAGWKVILLDLRNYWDKSLSTLAELSTLPLTKTPTSETPDIEAGEWCAAACRVTQTCVARLAGWHTKQNQGHWSFTVSGMALSSFRHRFMRHNIECTALPSDRDFERRAYYNGRTEAFWLGEIRNSRFYGLRPVPYDHSLFQERPRGPFHLIDSRSFYGAVAAFQSMPYKCIDEGEGWPDADADDRILDESFLAEVEIQSTDQEFPVRMADRTIFARGHFSTVLCGPELKRAVATRSILHVGRWRRYELDPILYDYGWGVWNDRVLAERGGDKLIAALCKSLLARLHGKFLQRDSRWEVCEYHGAPGPWRRWSDIDYETDTLINYRSIGHEVQKEKPAGDAKHCFPAIAAFVTSYGREWLRTWMHLAGPRNVLYCSTDSLLLTDAGKENLCSAGIIGNHGIGACRVVESNRDIALYGANNFRIGRKLCMAGLPVGCTRHSVDTADYSTYPSLRSTISSRPTESVTETCQTATIDATGEKTRLTSTGWLLPQTLNDGAPQWNLIGGESLM